jgi:hypothetical protein
VSCVQVLPHLPKLHSLQVVDVSSLELWARDLRAMMQDLPLADFVAPKPYRSRFNLPWC